jgi:glycosyltransferase involved in cell wall biosynthesis
MENYRQLPKVCIFGLISKHPGRNWGGTAMSIRRLANFFAGNGCHVDILTRELGKGHFLPASLADGIVIRPIRASNKALLFLALCGYLLKERPAVLLALDTRASLIASWVSLVPRRRTRIWASFRSELNADQAKVLRRIARRVDGVIAIAQSMAEEFRRLSGIPGERLHVIHNLAVSPDLAEHANASIEHPWLNGDAYPVICCVARLVPGKGLQYLIEAFAVVKRQHPNARLIIIGQGPLLETLRELAASLNMRDSIDFAGFQKNPWAFMARADLYCHPSLFEAFGNTLAEALSLGVPVVATDCPYGPAEILDHGRYGRLVPPADSRALAEAILATLRSPLPREKLVEGSQRFREEVAGRRYLETLGLERPAKAPAP